jgi:hypothetical protein
MGGGSPELASTDQEQVFVTMREKKTIAMPGDHPGLLPGAMLFPHEAATPHVHLSLPKSQGAERSCAAAVIFSSDVTFRGEYS